MVRVYSVSSLMFMLPGGMDLAMPFAISPLSLQSLSPTFSLSSSTFSVRRKSSTRRFLNLGGDGCNRDVEGAAFDEGRLLQELEEDACYLEVEARLFAAAHAQRFVKAAAARDDIFCVQLDDAAEVIRVNGDFYCAFSQKDVAAMSAVWLKRDDVSCVHPGQPPLLGHRNIMRTWTSMLVSRDEQFQANVIQPSRVACSVKGSSAWVTCLEDVSVQARSGGRGGNGGGGKSIARQMHATNVFRKIGGRWYLVHHHASPVPPSHSSFTTAPGTDRSLGSDNGRPTKKQKKRQQRKQREQKIGKTKGVLAGLLGDAVSNSAEDTSIGSFSNGDENEDSIIESATIASIGEILNRLPSYTSEEGSGSSDINGVGARNDEVSDFLAKASLSNGKRASINPQEVTDRSMLLQEEGEANNEAAALKALCQAASSSSSLAFSSGCEDGGGGGERNGMVRGDSVRYVKNTCKIMHKVAIRPFRPLTVQRDSRGNFGAGVDAHAPAVMTGDGIGQEEEKKKGLRALEPQRLSFGWARDTLTQCIMHVTPRGQAERAG
jgi:ketosteroid isomerase-like protein